MSVSTNSVNGNGKLYASRRNLCTEDIQPNSNKNCEEEKTDCASVPRHRIAGKQRMPPYIEAPNIEVPEPRRARSQSRSRSTSQNRTRNVSQAMHQFGNSEENGLCLSVRNQMELNEPLLVNDALVMLVSKSCLPLATPTSITSEKNISSKDVTKENGKVKQESRQGKVSFSQDTSQFDNGNGHILGKKVPPLYVPRPYHEVDNTEWDSGVAMIDSSESDDENVTPWGKRLAAIKVSRIKRDFNEDAISIEAPEGTVPVCARCGVAVYLAEEKRAAGRRFHISCFKCFLCNCSLDSMKLYERNQEVYCKSCYIRQFGPKGYDYGTGEGALRME